MSLSDAVPCSDRGFELGKLPQKQAVPFSVYHFRELLGSLRFISGGGNLFREQVLTMQARLPRNSQSSCPGLPSAGVLGVYYYTAHWHYNVYLMCIWYTHAWCLSACVQLYMQKPEEHVRFLCHYLVPFKQCFWLNQNLTSHVCWPANPSNLPVFAPTSEVTGIYGHTQLLHGCWDGSPCLLQMVFPAELLSSPTMLILIPHSKWDLLNFTTEKFPFLPLLLVTTPGKFFRSLVSHTPIRLFPSILDVSHTPIHFSLAFQIAMCQLYWAMQLFRHSLLWPYFVFS